MPDPIDAIEWVHAESLTANSYNPNVVFNQELRLLERSILKIGWVQPIIISRDNMVIDGFHRWMLARESKELQAKYAGLVPVARLDVGPDVAMVLTVRMNRAKGTHVAVRMSSLVKRLIDDHGWDPQQVAQEIGANLAEVELLYQDSIFKAKNIAEYRYSKAWVPYESSGGDPEKGGGVPRVEAM